jgi:hypothetical protein
MDRMLPEDFKELLAIAATYACFYVVFHDHNEGG